MDSTIEEVDGVEIEGLAAYVPARSVANDEKAAKATGIACRRVAADGETALDLSLRAAERLLAETGADPGDFGAAVSVSFTQHERMPCGACQAQARLGLPKDVIAFDVMQACAGYGHGLYIAALLARQTGRKVLLLDGDKQSEFLDGADPATSPILGDAGSATIVAAGGGGNGEAWKFAFASDGAKGGALSLERGGSIKMDGFGVFRFVATDVAARLKAFLAAVAPDGGDFLFAPHQANVYMLRQLAKAVGVPEDRLLVSADRFGNPSSASIPVTLAAHAGRVRGSRVLIAGFGGGLSVALGALRIPPASKVVLVDG